MDKDYEIEKIKGEELGKQMVDDRLKGKHTRLEIVIGKDKTPIVNLNNKGNGLEGMAVLYMSLEEIRKIIERKYPLAVEFANEYLKCEGSVDLK